MSAATLMLVLISKFQKSGGPYLKGISKKAAALILVLILKFQKSGHPYLKGISKKRPPLY